jgi:DNA-binding IclR family transcriptional regulator
MIDADLQSGTPPAPAPRAAAVRGRAPALVPAVTRAMALLDLLAEQRQALSLTELASRLQLPKSSVHGLCNTLATRGYLRRFDDGSFFIGPGVMGLAHAFVSRTSAAQEFASLWQELSAPPDETIILSVLAGADVIYVAARNGDRPLGLAFTIGMRLPAHLTASGKAMLAFHDEAFVRGLYPGGRLPARGRRGPSGLKQLRDELAQVRSRGYSVDDEGVREGVFCFGAPVFDAAGLPVAGVGVCTHKATLDRKAEQRHREVVVQCAARLTQRLGGRAPVAAVSVPARRTHA